MLSYFNDTGGVKIIKCKYQSVCAMCDTELCLKCENNIPKGNYFKPRKCGSKKENIKLSREGQE